MDAVLTFAPTTGVASVCRALGMARVKSFETWHAIVEHVSGNRRDAGEGTAELAQHCVGVTIQSGEVVVRILV